MIPTVTNPLGTDYRQPLTLTALSASSSVTLNATGSPVVSGLKYRTRSGSWQTYTTGTTVSLPSPGDYVQFWNTAGQLSTGILDCVQFAMTGTIAGSGNVQSLLNFSMQAPYSCFYKLFLGCASLIYPPEFPATTLSGACYYNTFYDCSALLTAPALPATALAGECYKYMFYHCSSLTAMPALPATALSYHCYKDMFNGCTSMASMAVLPAPVLAANCYEDMFINCRSLTGIEVNFTSWTGFTNATNNWVYGVSAAGTFTKPADLPEEYGASRIPTGWTIINK